MLIEDVKCRLEFGYDCECLNMEEANLKIAPDEVVGATHRCKDITVKAQD